MTDALAYLGLGSNLGDRAANLWRVAARIAALPRCHLDQLSGLYETDPIGPVPQGPFLNAVAAIRTEMPPLDLLRACKQVERDLGRVPGPRWGPRLIDIDVLLYSDTAISTAELTLPHPELWNRRFVLAPLLDVLPAGELQRRAARRLGEIGASQGLWAYPRDDAARGPGAE